MTKVLLVEDDNNLREIYEARLAAEGYDISSAQDGEEALVVAKQAKPDLVISDVMMPKISGFEMLDILRNTPGLEHVKVIMLTALGQSEDRDRADSLGADKYLVKSQVTLEDIVKTAHELLGDADPVAPATEPINQPAAAPSEVAAPTPEVLPVSTAPAGPVVAEPVSTDNTGSADDTTTATEPVTPPEDSLESILAQTGEPLPSPEVVAEPVAAKPVSTEQGLDGSTAQEETIVTNQIDDFVNTVAAEPVEAELPAPIEDTAVAPATPTTTEPVVEEPTTDTVEPAPAPAEPEVIAPESQPAVESAPSEVPVEATPEEAPTDNLAPTAEQLATTADDQIMANAVTELAGGTVEEPTTDTVEPAPAPAEPEVIAPESQPAVESAPSEVPVEATPEEAKAEAEKTNISISGKKTIQPLSASESKPDINELLAREEAASVTNGPVTISNPEANPAEATEPPAIIHQPGASFSPQPPSSEPSPTAAIDEDQPSGGPAPAPGGVDPNSIAL